MSEGRVLNTEARVPIREAALKPGGVGKTSVKGSPWGTTDADRCSGDKGRHSLRPYDTYEVVNLGTPVFPVFRFLYTFCQFVPERVSYDNSVRRPA